MEKELKRLAQYFGGKIPGVIDFALGVILALVVFGIGVKLIKWIRKIVRRSLERGNVDKGVCQFTDSLLKFSLYALLIFSILQKFGLDTATVAAALASCGVAIGLALQGSLSNFAGGVLILLLKPFVVGDYIVEDNKGREGTVTEIQMFYTKLLTTDNRTVVIPNGTLANTSLTNVTAQDKRRLDLTVGVAYDTDLKKAKMLVQSLLERDEDIIQARGWVKKDMYWTTKWRLLENIKETFDNNGIEIPFNQIVVHTDIKE